MTAITGNVSQSLSVRTCGSMECRGICNPSGLRNKRASLTWSLLPRLIREWFTLGGCSQRLKSSLLLSACGLEINSKNGFGDSPGTRGGEGLSPLFSLFSRRCHLLCSVHKEHTYTVSDFLVFAVVLYIPYFRQLLVHVNWGRGSRVLCN